MRHWVALALAGCIAESVVCRHAADSDMSRIPMNRGDSLTEAQTSYHTPYQFDTCDISRPSADKGVDPIHSVKIGPVNGSLATRGESIFKRHCSHCHSLTTTEIGPNLCGITGRRTPEYIMNMIINPQGMEEKDSLVIKLVRCYGILMPPLGLDSAQARAALEFLTAGARARVSLIPGT